MRFQLAPGQPAALAPFKAGSLSKAALPCASRRPVGSRGACDVQRAGAGLDRLGQPRQRDVRPTSTHFAAEGAPTAAQGAAAEDSPSQFNWLRHWYPVMPLEDLASLPLRPYPVTLFGRELVVWADGRGGAHCFADMCPHRLAPLSEGTVVVGTLECSYHGWRFAGGGRCAGIPQLAGTPGEGTALASPRACATAYPTRQLGGLLWVWPDASETGCAAAERAEPAIPPEVLESLEGGTLPAGQGAESGRRYINTAGGWLVRDIPYSFDFLLENVLDVSHVLFAHHGVLGRREDAVPFAMSFEEPVSLQGGLQLALGSHSRKLQVSDRRLAFRPPCFTHNVLHREGGSTMAICGYAVPTKPGHSRVVSTSYATDSSPLARAVLGLVPRPLLHAVLNEVLDGDLLLVREQERNLKKLGGEWPQRFYMPAPCDSSILAFRKWWDLAGGDAGLPWAGSAISSGAALAEGEAGPAPSREQLLSRMSHIQNCASCRRMLRLLKTAERLGYAAAGALVLLLAALGPGGRARVLLAVGAICAAGAAAVAGWLQPHLTGKDYVHHEHRH